MFFGAIAFNQNISLWNVASVTTLSSVLSSASVLVSLKRRNNGLEHIVVCSQMFTGASAFNQNISSWDTARVRSMYQVCSLPTDASGLIALATLRAAFLRVFHALG
jgi:surface protein